MSNTNVIYMVSTTRYWGGVLSGFATGPDGIRRILQKHYDMCRDRTVTVEIDMETATVQVIEADGWERSYYIIRVEEA